jgi:peptidoglycan hydrolase CwlO-like protein
MECKVKYALLSIALFLMSVAASGADTSPSLPTPPETEQAAPGKPNAAQQLDELVNALATARAELKVLQKKAAATRDETEKKQIEAEEQEVTSFDWHKEIEDLFKPLVYELKRLTERPRRIEQLRTQQSLLEGRLAQADDALENSVFLRGEWRPITLASNAC